MKIINYSNDCYQNVDVMLYNYGYEECDSGHFYGPAVRKSYMIHYITAGKGIFRVNHQTYELSTGDAFLMKPGEEIYYEADKKEPWCYAWIGVQGAKIEHYLNCTTLLEKPVFHYDKDERLVKIYNQFFKATNEPVLLRELKANRAIYDLFAFLIENFPNHQSQDKKDDLSYIKEAVAYCNLNLDKPIKVQEIADHLNLNRSYLARLFKQKTGVSLKQYLSHLRIENAKELLTKTELPVNVIACSIGFSDPLYFSKFFKKRTGHSPEKYRQVEVDVQERQQYEFLLK